MSRVLVKHLGANVNGLPRLPIPTVSATLGRYRKSVSHLKKSEIVDKHMVAVNSFESTYAHGLNVELLEMDKAAAASGEYPFSYIEKTWDDGYLAYRGPSPINVSPSFSLKNISAGGQTKTAAKIAFAVTTWIKRAVVTGLEVEPSVDASQLAFQFCCSRAPGEHRDTCSRTDLEKMEHVTVLHDGYAYLVRVCDCEGKLMSEQTLEKAFEHILTVTRSDDHPAPVSVLTSGPRDDWAASVAELVRSIGNEALLKKIQHSAIVICLDSQEWEGSNQIQKAMLFGGVEECENRWYDKHQIIISKTGQVAMNFEHAFSDGMSWCKWIGEILQPQEDCSLPLAASSAIDIVEPVNFEFGKSFASRIRNARSDVKALTESVELASAIIPTGKKILKKMKFSPDAFAQMVFHYAFYKMRGKIGPTYESCSTNKFFHGRTETIRTATNDMLLLLQALENNSANSECQALMRQALAAHVQLAKEASNAQGIDRHLLALQKLAETKGDDSASFFNEELYKYSSTWLMSTSNLSMPYIEYFNFGPVSENGYGIGYVVDDECIRVCISSWVSSSRTNADEMKCAIEMAAARLLTVLTNNA